MSVLDDLERLSPKILQYVHDGRNLENQIVDVQQKIHGVVGEIDKLHSAINLHNKALTVFNSLVHVMSEQHINKVQELVASALQTIFYDRNYSFEISVTDRGSDKQAEMFLVEIVDEQVVRSAIRGGVGGGIQTVVGFVLQIFYILHLGAPKIMFLDEAFSQLSVQYIEGFMTFIKTLVDKHEFRFVLVSHDDRLIQYSNYILKVERGVIYNGKER